MEGNGQSLALKYDLYVNNVLKFLDTTVERDYILKLKVINELMYKISESEADKITIKKTLESAQDECSKLSYKLKTSARLFDEVQGEKEKLAFEKRTLESQLENLYNAFNKTNPAEKSQTHDVNSNEKIFPTLNTTGALLSDLSYSNFEDSTENVFKSSIPNPVLIKKNSSYNVLNDDNVKTCEVRNVNISGKQIISTTTLTMEANSMNAISVIKTLPAPTSKASLLTSSSSTESVYSDGSEKEVKNTNYYDENNEKEHNFVKKIIVVPEMCGQCYEKVKFNNYMIKCLDCKTIAHLECKDRIPVVCKFGKNKVCGLKSAHSTPSQKIGSPRHFLSTEQKRRIIGSPRKCKAAKKVEFFD